MRAFAIISLCVLAACSTPVAPPMVSQKPIDNITEYFWPTSGTMSFVDTNGVVKNTLTFSASTISDGANKPLTTTVSSDKIYAAGFGDSSLIDPDVYFSALDTEVWIQPAIHAAIVGEGPDVYVATDSGMYTEHTGDVTPQQWGLNGVSDISLLARREYPADIFAATRSGTIWARDPAGASWQKLPSLPVAGAIQAMWVGQDSTLYASVHGTSGFYQYSDRSNSWSQPQYLSTKTVTAFGGAFYFSGQFYLLVGCEDGTIGFYRSTATPLSFFQLPDAPKVNAFQAKTDGQFFVATEVGIFQCTANLSSQPTLFVSKTGVTSIALINPSSFYYEAGGTLYQYGGVGPLSQPANHVLQLLGHSSLHVITDSDIVTLNASKQWQREYGFPIGWWPEVPGGLTLLQKDVSEGASWRAGTLVDDKHHSYRVTASVLGRLDSLQVRFPATQHTYGDILIVDYSYTKESVLHEWIVYYQRGRGPIMFDTRDGGHLIDRRAIKETP